MSVKIRPAHEDDVAQLLRLNNDAVPNVNELSLDQMQWFLANVEFFQVAEVDGKIAGLLSALPTGSDYSSQYYRHVCSSFSDFMYIDRVFVDAEARGRRVGEQLYDALKVYARAAGYLYLYCEVNIEPPNPGSMRFHKRIGFKDSGVISNPEKTKIVQVLCCALDERLSD